MSTWLIGRLKSTTRQGLRDLGGSQTNGRLKDSKTEMRDRFEACPHKPSHRYCGFWSKCECGFWDNWPDL